MQPILVVENFQDYVARRSGMTVVVKPGLGPWRAEVAKGSVMPMSNADNPAAEQPEPTKAELQDELREAGLPVSGSKPELIERLEDAGITDSPAAEAPKVEPKKTSRPKAEKTGLADAAGSADPYVQKLMWDRGSGADPAKIDAELAALGFDI